MSSTNSANAQKKAKILLVLIDGIADLGLLEYNNQTPLQAGDYPIFNAIARSGVNGLMDPVETGLACGSDTAHMNIFGYIPFDLYRGRGAFESMGAGLKMDSTEIAFKCNFAHMDVETQIVKLRRVDRDFQQWGLPLIDELNGLIVPDHPNHYITVQHATEHRCGVILSGPNLTDCITGTDPLKDNLALRKVLPKDPNNQAAIQTAHVVNKLSEGIHQKLAVSDLNVKRRASSLPDANIVLLRGAGMKLDVETFEQRQGLKGFMIAPTAIINGLGQTIGLDIVVAPGATGDYHSDYSSKIRTAFSTFTYKPEYDFGFLHIKAVDDAGHDKSVSKKMEYLSKVDAMLKEFTQLALEAASSDTDYVICVTGDHTTPVRLGDHTFEPVPVTVTLMSNLLHELHPKESSNSESETTAKREKSASELLKDNVTEYNEISAASGVLGRFPGSQLIPTLKKIKTVAERI